jgi:transcriptional regulator with XRE-family HTH domain
MTERLQIDGRAFRALRLKRGMRQAELAAEAGISERLVGMIEGGSRPTQARPIIYALARALGVTPAEFVVNMPPDPARHRAAVERALAEAPAVDAELSRAMRDLLAGYAARAKEDRDLADALEAEDAARLRLRRAQRPA